MMLAGVIGYYVFAISVIGFVGYLAYRRNIRDLEAAAERARAGIRAMSHTPPMPGPLLPGEPVTGDEEPDTPPDVLLRIKCDDRDLQSVIDYLDGRGLHPAVVGPAS